MPQDSSSERRPRGRPKAFHDKTEQNTIQSLDRALGVLDHLAHTGGGTLSELAKGSNQSPATLYRVLSTFQLHDITEFDEASQLWQIGPSAYRIGAAFLRRSSVMERSRPVMRKLMQDTGETANLGVVRADMVMFISQVETHESIRAFFPPGTQSQMHASGIGKALLAFFPPDRLDAWLKSQELTRYTDKTLTSRDALLRDLESIRTRGFSHDDEERNIGMRCIAAPVFDTFGEPVAGLSVSGPTSRMTRGSVEDVAKLVRAAAGEVTKAIGGTAA
jgi:IclR family acetate operon transcriptional repressor